MNKKKIMTGLVLFLGFMWICTVISKSVYASSLPMVSTQEPEQKYVEHVVEATGIVTEGSKQAVNVLAGLRVEALSVRQGDRVEEGEALFQVDLEDLQNLMEDLQTQEDKLQLQIDALLANQELEQQRKAIQEERAREDYDYTARQQGTLVGRAEENYVQAEEDLEDHQNDPVYITPEEERERVWVDYYNWLSEEERLNAEVAEQERIVTNMETPSQEEDGDGEKADEEKKQLEKEKAKLQSLRQALADHQSNRIDQPDFSGEDAALSAWEQKKEALEDALQAAAYGEADAKGQRDEAIKQAQRNIEDILFPESVDAALSLYRIELEAVQKDLSVYQEIIDQEGIIRAPNSGTITDVFVSVGGRVPDTASVLMTDDTVPFQLKVILDQEQKQYVGLGDMVTLKLDGSMTRIDGVVNYLFESSSLPGRYETYVNLPEDVGSPGLSGTLVHAETGEKYSCCIPALALHSMNNRSYVYVLRQREGILGMEYYVEELTVKVLDQNSDWVAIGEGVLDAESKVILSSDKEITKGQTVRYQER